MIASRRLPLLKTFAALAAACLALPAPAQAPAAAEPAPFKLGVVTFLSGAAAGPFGVPARNAAEVLVEALNAGKVPGPYATKGFGGRPVQLVFIDEAGGTTKQVSEYRDLVQRQNVDAVIGYISSGDCLAVAPVAEELKRLTVFFDCGTPRIFEDASYKYVFRTSSHAAMDNVAAALYVNEMLPATKKIAGINQNYAWGQDSWNDFEATMKVLKPGRGGHDLADAEAPRRPVRRRDLRPHVRAAPTSSTPASGAATSTPSSSRRCPAAP